MNELPSIPLASIEIEFRREGQVAEVIIAPPPKAAEPTEAAFFDRTADHKELGQAVAALRDDHRVRVIVLTGVGSTFLRPPARSPGVGERLVAEDVWVSMGIHRTLTSIIETEKPVVAKVNGDAIGFGASVVFACDFVIANKDARIVDHHLAMGDQGYGQPNAGVVPGDGAAVFVPLAMPPALAKEFLLLGRPLTGEELTEMGVFNAAVSSEELDGAVDDLIGRLLRRPRAALGWGKRVINLRVQENLARAFDAAWGYELVTLWMGEEGQKAAVPGDVIAPPSSTTASDDSLKG